jgi:hypothetical protein
LIRAQWEYANGAYRAASHHGVGTQVVREALQEMGLTNLSAEIGTGVRVSDTELWRNLPDGSIVYSGSPQQPQRLSVQAKVKGRWVHMLGDQPAPGEEVMVEAVGGVRKRPAWLDQEGTDTDVREIAKFRATAYRVGYRVKRAHGWCSTYDHVVSGLGITAQIAREAEAPESMGLRVHAEAARLLPVGSLLWWRNRHHPDQYALFERVDTMTNQAATRRVFASAAVPDNEQYKRHMLVVATATNNREVAWPLPENLAQAIWNLLPTGSRFMYRQGGENQYVICADKQAIEWRGGNHPIPERGQWQFANFGDDPQLVVTAIGTIE